MKIFLPYRSEFGLVCMFHAPQVYACKEEKAVVIARGMEALYPDCQYIYVEDRPDEDKRANDKEFARQWKHENRKKYKGAEFVYFSNRAEKEYFTPESTCKLDKYLAGERVAICARGREYGPDKNWSHWAKLVACLHQGGVGIVSIGDCDTSQHLGCYTCWGLDAAIAHLKRASLCLTTDCGVAHLAVMCGTPLAMISHADGIVADGHDDVGKPYWPIKMERFGAENHLNSPIDIIKYAWQSHEPVLRYLNEKLATSKDSDIPHSEV